MTLGPYRGGCIRLWRGASGRPLKDSPPGEKLLIGEGIEDCLTAACVAPEYRVVCAVSLSNLAAIVLPPAVAEIVILAQNDPPQSPAARALDKAVTIFRRQGRRVKIARPPAGFKDVNELQRAHAARSRGGQ